LIIFSSTDGKEVGCRVHMEGLGCESVWARVNFKYTKAGKRSEEIREDCKEVAN